MARGDRHISWLVGVEGVARRKIPIDSSGLRVECGIVSCGMRCVHPSIVLTFIGGVEIGVGQDGSGEWEMFASSTRTTAIVASTLKGLGGRLRSLTLGGTIGC